MKKIMFNDMCGLTQAVLEGRKTQTRRIARIEDIVPNITCYPRTYPYAHYRVGEEVAIAQSYKDAKCDYYFHAGLPGWRNKMFVRAAEMPHRIKITDIRVERLHDISEEDCLKEGIVLNNNGRYIVERYKGVITFFTTDARLAFEYLIDKICGRGTWDSNPWVFVYDFELIK